MPDAPAPTILDGLGLTPADGGVPAPVAEPAAAVPPAAPAAPAVPAAPAPEPIVVPEGARNPDAVQKAIAAERETARLANAERRRLEAELEAERAAALPLADQLALAQAGEQAAALTAMRFEVAAEAGLPLNLASRLNGSTREELTEDVKTFSSQVGTITPAPLVAPEGGLRLPPPVKANPELAHNALISALVGQGRMAAPQARDPFAGLEPAPQD